MKIYILALLLLMGCASRDRVIHRELDYAEGIIELDLASEKNYRIINAPLHSSMLIDDEEMYRIMSDYNRNKYPEYIESLTER